MVRLQATPRFSISGIVKCHAGDGVHVLKMMKMPFFIIAVCCVFAFGLSQNATANLLQNGTFQSVTFSGTAPAGNYNTSALFGQFGSDSVGGFASGSHLTVAGWDTSGYNFVYAPNTADRGTQANAYTTMTPGSSNINREVPGQYSSTHSGGTTLYGNTYFWGNTTTQTGTTSSPNNGGAGVMVNNTGLPGYNNTAGTGNINAVYNAAGAIVPGNFIAMDGVYEVHPVSQTVTGLTIGSTYILTFYYAGAQQEGFSGDTTESLTVNFGGTFVSTNSAQSGYFTGGQTYTTNTISLPSHAFSGWYQGSVLFSATSTSTTLNFLAGGSPAGEPPFTLLGGVDMELVPDYSNWMIFTGFGALCIFFEVLRRRRQSKADLSTPGALAETISGLAGKTRMSGETKLPAAL